MKRYTIKNLPSPTREQPDDMRLYFTDSRFQFLWCAFKNLLYNETRIMKVLLGIIITGAIIFPIIGGIRSTLVCWIALIGYYGRFFWYTNKLITMKTEGNMFPLLTSEGPQYAMYNGTRYHSVETPSWQEVKHISFYNDFFVIEMKKESEYGYLFMWSDDMENAKQTALSMWSNALQAKEKNEVMPELYSDTEIDEITNFIENTFGKFDNVYHEFVSPDVHLDVAIIPPSEERNYYTLCTLGAGAHRMILPEDIRYESEAAERVELLIYLPADWNLSEEALSDERNYWPIRLLKDFARMPITANDWMAWGHTCSNEDEKQMAKDVPYTSAVLLCPQPDIEEVVSCSLSVGKTIDFFQVFPISQKELEYKLNYEDDEELSDTDALLDHIHADREHWMNYVLSRYKYREKK